MLLYTTSMDGVPGGGNTVEVHLLARMALTPVVIGTAASVMGTGRVTMSLVASTALCWSFVPVLQLLTGLLLVRGAAAKGSALARYFATDRYWSSWMLALAAVVLLMPNPGGVVLYLLGTAVVPLLLTARALVWLRRDLSGDSRAAARTIVVLHQTITILLILAYAMWAGALWPRIVRTLAA